MKRVEADGNVVFVAGADGRVLAAFNDRDATCATLVEHDALLVSSN